MQKDPKDLFSFAEQIFIVVLISLQILISALPELQKRLFQKYPQHLLQKIIAVFILQK